MVAGVGSVDRYTNINTRTNDFAPRVGIAYQLNPKTVVRAGYGRSYFPNFFSIQISHNFPVDFVQSLTASTELHCRSRSHKDRRFRRRPSFLPTACFRCPPA